MERFILNETSYFGKGARKVLVEEIKKRNFTSVLVVTDEELFKIGVSSKITDMLEAEDIKYSVFHDVKPNEIFLATFTEKAALQLKQGLQGLLSIASTFTKKTYDLFE